MAPALRASEVVPGAPNGRSALRLPDQALSHEPRQLPATAPLSSAQPQLTTVTGYSLSTSFAVLTVPATSVVPVASPARATGGAQLQGQAASSTAKTPSKASPSPNSKMASSTSTPIPQEESLPAIILGVFGTLLVIVALFCFWHFLRKRTIRKTEMLHKLTQAPAATSMTNTFVSSHNETKRDWSPTSTVFTLPKRKDSDMQEYHNEKIPRQDLQTPRAAVPVVITMPSPQRVIVRKAPPHMSAPSSPIHITPPSPRPNKLGIAPTPLVIPATLVVPAPSAYDYPRSALSPSQDSPVRSGTPPLASNLLSNLRVDRGSAVVVGSLSGFSGFSGATLSAVGDDGLVLPAEVVRKGKMPRNAF